MIVLIIIGIILAVLITAFIIELLIAGLYPHVTVPEQPLEKKPDLQNKAKKDMNKADVTFDVNGTAISAWLFLPQPVSSPVPCVVMAHGLGGTKSMGLDDYAVRFQEAGMAVLAFDYRYNGESSGNPRQLIWIPSQLEDYAAAVDYVRNREEIDPARVALWGTSLSGGHVLVTAAQDSKIACVSAQCPLLDGVETAETHVHQMGVKYVLRMTGHGQRDLFRSWVGLSPHKIPIVGKPGTVALMANMDAWNTFLEMAPDDFINEACARIAVRMDKYRPVNKLGLIRCPVLLQVGDNDMAVPAKVVSKARKLLGHHGQVINYPIDHFDFYHGDNFKKAVTDQIAFFKKHLT